MNSAFFDFKKFRRKRYYYEHNKAEFTTKIQPLAVFAEKSRPFIYRYSVGEPPGHACPVHSPMGQAAGQKPILYTSEAVDQAAYAGVYASQDSDSVFDGPEDTDSCVLGKLCAGQDFSILKSNKPSIVTYID